MKTLARGHLWWPGLDTDIEKWVGTCTPCQESRPSPPRTTPTQWETPRGPWSRLHIDFAGPIQQQHFLIVVDAYSKWLEVIIMKSTTSCATIRALNKLFTTHGLPDIVVSDNGPQFTSRQMELYLANLGIRHALIAPFSPPSNGQAERMVRVTKEALARADPGDWQEKLDTFLLTQHITPNPVTLKSPAELLMNRKIRSILDRMHPTYTTIRETPTTPPGRTLAVGDTVYAKNYDGGGNWKTGVVLENTGPKSYIIKLDDGREWRRHIDQLRSRQTDMGPRQPDRRTVTEDVPDDTAADFFDLPWGSEDNNRAQVDGRDDPSVPLEAGVGIAGSTPQGPPDYAHSGLGGAAQEPASLFNDAPPTELRRSSRETRRPVRLEDYITYLH